MGCLQDVLDPYGARRTAVSLTPDVTNKDDVGNREGTTWALSSAKMRHGVAELMDDDLNALWQSDGAQPHFVDISFPSQTAVTHLSLYLDCHRDDSYTPTKVLVKAGTHPYDLVDVRYREFTEPQGWYHFVLRRGHELSMEEADASLPLGATTPLHPIDVFVLQVCILGNHLNGKDTHIRGLRVFGPPEAGVPHAEGSPGTMQQPFPPLAVRVGGARAVRPLPAVPPADRSARYALGAASSRLRATWLPPDTPPPRVGSDAPSPRGDFQRSMEAILRRQLKQWQRGFRQQHGREPSKSDIRRHSEISSTYDTWRALADALGDRKGSGARTRVRPRLVSPPHPSESALQAPGPATPIKARKTAPPPPPSPGNPFRSPRKAHPAYSQAPFFPSRSVPRASGVVDSDVEDADDLVPELSSAQKPQTPVKTLERRPTLSPAGSSAPVFTPRTKARKRLRGEDVRTPPRPKPGGSAHRAAASPQRHAAPPLKRNLDAPTPPRRTKQLFRTDSRETQCSGVDMLGPSPRKGVPQQREFRPLFRSASAGRGEEEDVQTSIPGADTPMGEPPAEQCTDTTARTALAPLPLPLTDPDDEAPSGRRVVVLPYQRFGSARARMRDGGAAAPRRGADDDAFAAQEEEGASADDRDPLDALQWALQGGADGRAGNSPGGAEDAAWTEMTSADCVPHEEETHATRPPTPLTTFSSLTLFSPARQAARTADLGRLQKAAVVDALLEAGSPAAPRTSQFVRTGRAGLDTDESGAARGESDVSDWASEASSVDYGWGDGEMDRADIL
ncbi:hypothetical protein MSPP1_002358 [Malassezia sp. CBS 17886]|nr:hypothetical protein MSPP1_002358 [Malassezia sp. CBS 17886]